jgi:two-component system OmpR family response regulator
MLPDKDGREVYLELRRRGDHTPVIFLSAQPDIEDRTKDLNPVAIVSKPFQMNVLVNLLQSHLELAADASLTECDS